ncbi:MAG TPA: hypothetical protein VLX91_05590 [Candidatus Acidoferrales bacterium]|nr:hypothetical protein [Candidatus Acidoferrales bacterium]
MTLAIYRYVSIIMAIIFGVVGILFLFMSSDVLVFFNRMSGLLGMEQGESAGEHFYVILAVAYMYVVALLAFLMYHDPRNASFPFILFNAKVASSIVSAATFLFGRHLLIYITNCIVDGLIGLMVFAMYRCVRRVCQ